MMVGSTLGSILSGVTSTLSFLYFGLVLDDLNMVEVDVDSIMRVLIWYGVIVVVSSVLCYFERLLLGYFAGNDRK